MKKSDSVKVPSDKKVIYLSFDVQIQYGRMLELEKDEEFMKKLGEYNKCISDVKTACGDGDLNKEVWSNDATRRLVHWEFLSSGSISFNSKEFIADHPGIDYSDYYKKGADKKTFVWTEKEEEQV